MSGTCYLRSGNDLWPAENAALNRIDRLPVGTYSVQLDPRRGFYFSIMQDFDIPSKIYGQTIRNADRIINTYGLRPNSTGVLLTGEKGSGKTMLAKTISKKAREKGMPTLVVNNQFVGDDFNKLIQEVRQDAVVLFDEFEKVYDRDHQPHLLTLLDGIYTTKKLFLLTCNDSIKIDVNMHNRPGRIFYNIEYRGLDADFIKEYCLDRLDEHKHIDKIVQISSLFHAFSFDMLAAVVEEMNRYKEDPLAALEILNAKPNVSNEAQYTVKVVSAAGVEYKRGEINCSLSGKSPLTQKEWWVNVSRMIPPKDGKKHAKGEDDWEERHLNMNTEHMQALNSDTGEMIYKSEDGDLITFVKQLPKHFSYGSVLGGYDYGFPGERD